MNEQFYFSYAQDKDFYDKRFFVLSDKHGRTRADGVFSPYWIRSNTGDWNDAFNGDRPCTGCVFHYTDAYPWKPLTNNTLYMTYDHPGFLDKFIPTCFVV